MIELKDVSLSLGGQPLLERCSLRLPAGSHTALMGESGSGKTSLLRLLLGLQRPDAGSVRVEGRVACAFQEPRLLPWRSAVENVNVVLSDSPATLPEAREWLRRVELEGAAEKFPAELSGGMQQRLSIARALAYGGDVLLLDEPLKGCDAALRERLLALLQGYAAGKTLLLVTHDRREAEALAEDVYLLADRELRPWTPRP